MLPLVQLTQLSLLDLDDQFCWIAASLLERAYLAARGLKFTFCQISLGCSWMTLSKYG